VSEPKPASERSVKNAKHCWVSHPSNTIMPSRWRTWSCRGYVPQFPQTPRQRFWTSLSQRSPWSRSDTSPSSFNGDLICISNIRPTCSLVSRRMNTTEHRTNFHCNELYLSQAQKKYKKKICHDFPGSFSLDLIMFKSTSTFGSEPLPYSLNQVDIIVSEAGPTVQCKPVALLSNLSRMYVLFM
jgi:hypothetical protein